MVMTYETALDAVIARIGDRIVAHHALVDRVQALEEAVERIEARVPFVAKHIPEGSYWPLLNNLLGQIDRVLADGPRSPQIDDMRVARDRFIAASWGRSS